jgi:hypothetical protein
VDEWPGGQPYFAWAEPDPTDPSHVWFNSGSWLVRAAVDYDAGTWDVVETHHVGAMGDGIVRNFGHRGHFNPLTHDGTTYLVSDNRPQALRHEAGSLAPVSVSGAVDDSVRDLVDGPIDARRFAWVDRDGDGLPSSDELTFGDAGAPKWVSRTFDRIGQRSRRTDGGGFVAEVVEHPVTWTDSIPTWPFEAGDVIASTEEAWRPSGGRGGSGTYRGREGDIYTVYGSRGERHGTGWPSYWTGKTRLVKWDADGSERWKVGRNAHVGGLGSDHGQSPPGQFHVPVRILGDPRGTIVVADRVETPAMVWTKDGLYAGEFFDRRADDGLPEAVYSWWRDRDGNPAITASDNKAAGAVVETDDGRVIWTTQGRNSVPTYEVHGWDDWGREEGTVTIEDPPHAAADGSGLQADYWDAPSLNGPPVTERTDERAWCGYPRGASGGAVMDGFRGDMTYDWSDGVGPLDRTTGVAVRWTGEVEVPLTEAFRFTTYSMGGVRLWIDGEQRIFGWNEAVGQRTFRGSVEGLTTDPMPLTAGDRVPVQLDFYATVEKPACSLMWESFNRERERIPSAHLYPTDVAVADRPDARPATDPIGIETFDTQSGGVTSVSSGGGILGVDFTERGQAVGYRRLDFGDGVSSITVDARSRPSANDAVSDLDHAVPDAAVFDVRIGAPDGRSIGTVSLPTPPEDAVASFTGSVSSVDGAHDCYLVNRTPGPHRVLVESFRFA